MRFVRRLSVLSLSTVLFALIAAPTNAAAATRSWPPRFAVVPPASTGPDSAPVGLGVARLFGQGPDLAVADAVLGLLLMKNDGHGRFQYSGTLPAGNSATCVGVGDLTDGPVQSLAAANMLDTFLTVYVPFPNGGFQREDLPMTSSPQSVAMVDPSGDGRSAVMVGLYGPSGGELLLLSRSSDGWQTDTEADMPWTPMGMVPITRPQGTAVELAVSPISGHQMAIVRLASSTSIKVEQILTTDHAVVASAAIETSDGALAAAVGRYEATVWRRASGGAFNQAGVLHTDEALTGVAIKDLNGDGIPDIVATSTMHVIVWSGRPDGWFNPAQKVAPSNHGGAPVVADFDGDGRPDIAWNSYATRAVDMVRNTTQTGIPGDGDGDGVVDIADAILALRCAAGIVTPSAGILERLDVWPVQSDGSWGDGKITVDDAARILNWTVGLDD